MVITVDIMGKTIGEENPCYVIAEAGVNFNGNIQMAKQLIDVAADAGADVVKFQTFKAENVVTSDAPKANYALETTDFSESHLEMMRRLELPPEHHRALIDHAESRGILFLSSPFDHDSAELLASLGVPAFKIPSGEITNLPFLAHVASKGKPMIVSTGMSSLGEVENAVRVIEDAGNDEIVLMHCVSNYPANPADVNLRAMQTLALAFGRPVGFSDHTQGIQVPLAAVAMGAKIIEKHFTLDRNLEGPDHRASLEPDELVSMIRGIRIVESAIGDGRKLPADSEANTASVARKSLVAARDIPKDTLLSDRDLAIKRPGTGLQPSLLSYVIGRRTVEAVSAGTLLTFEMLA